MQMPDVAWQMRDFAGQWALTRQITDHFSGQTGHFNGRAVLKPTAAQCLDYAEEGWLHLGTTQLQASRRYLFDFSAGLHIRFTDGRLLIDAAGAQHHCANDLYEGQITRQGPNSWLWCWRVIGPRKDYAMQGRYIRLPE